MTTGTKGISLIKQFEGCHLKAYLCPAKVPTIGWGNTRYENGNKVRIGEVITQQRADELFIHSLKPYENIVLKKVKRELTQNQFDALVSHTYNTGGSTTLFDLVSKNAPDENIRKWFETKYIIGGGQVLKGLVRRRKAEPDLYLTK